MVQRVGKQKEEKVEGIAWAKREVLKNAQK